MKNLAMLTTAAALAGEIKILAGGIVLVSNLEHVDPARLISEASMQIQHLASRIAWLAAPPGERKS